MRVSELMQRDVVTIGAAASCYEALTRMCGAQVRHLPVLAPDGRLVGILTDRDLRHHLFGAGVDPRLRELPVETILRHTVVETIMSAPVESIASTADVGDAANVMRARKIGSLPVVDGERLVGIITEIDVLRSIVGDAASRVPELDIVVSFP